MEKVGAELVSFLIEKAHLTPDIILSVLLGNSYQPISMQEF